MAKRKRLGPARVTGAPTGASTGTPAETPETGSDVPADLETKSVFPSYPLGIATHRQRPAPIAAVAGQSASEAALAELSDTLRSAREEGRLIQALPLDAIEADHLVRDRLVADEEEMQTLISSIRARGQQTPVEGMALEGGRYGLISGWRRLTALRRLAEEDAKFDTVLAIPRRPDTAADAYRAMVEENEIRVGLSYYERARIVARAAEQGVYEDPKAALSGLFASASRPRRSKIGSFVRLHDALDDALRFPAAIPERLGLALVKEIDADPGFAPRLRALLADAGAGDAETEAEVLSRALRPAPALVSGTEPSAAKPGKSPVSGSDLPEGPGRGVHLSHARGRITLTGPGVSEHLARDLAEWLSARG